MKTLTGIELFFENCDSVALDAGDIALEVKGLTSSFDFARGCGFNKRKECKYLHIRFPESVVKTETKFGGNTLEDHLLASDFCGFNLLYGDDKGATTYIPWVDDKVSYQRNVSQHTYRKRDIDGSPEVSLYFFSDELHPEFKDFIFETALSNGGSEERAPKADDMTVDNDSRIKIDISPAHDYETLDAIQQAIAILSSKADELESEVRKGVWKSA